MVKRIEFAIISFVFIVLSLSVCFGAELEMSINATKTDLLPDEEFSVDFNITKNTGFNNYTFFVEYNPEVIMPVEFTSDDNTSDWIKNSEIAIVTPELINKQMEVVPATTDSDYTGLGADGSKTAAQLGKIKISGRVYTSSGLGTVTDTGKLFSMKFKANENATGDSVIKITPVNSGFAPLPSIGGELTTLYGEETVSVVNEKEVIIDETIYVINIDTGIIISVTTENTELNVPAVIDGINVTGVGERAFKDTTSIENLTLPSGTAKIGAYCFEGCSVLKTVSLPETVTEIDEYAFGGCSSVESITLPYKVKLSKGAFADCKALRVVKFAK